MDFRLLLILTGFTAVLGDDVGFLSCGNYTMQPVNNEDWYVRVGSDEKGTVKGYNFWFLIFKDARFNFERIQDDEPYFLISTMRWNDWFIYMTDTPNGQVESMNEKPGPEGQWMVQRVENGKYTLSPRKWPQKYMCMSDDTLDYTVLACDEAGTAGIFLIKKK